VSADRHAREVASALASALEAATRASGRYNVLCGFDGFVDEMITVVGERQGPGRYQPLTSMAELGRLLEAAAGRNTLREIVVRSQDAGGCAVNLGDGLASLGVDVHFWGTIGRPRHPAFDAFAARCLSCASLGTVYGRTLAFEFGDGKAMFSAVEQLGELDPALLAQADGEGRLSAAAASAQLIALTNWTLYPHMTACWRHLQRSVLSRCTQRPYLVVDLVDPSGRSEADIADMLAAIPGFQATCRTVLGLNLTELGVLLRVLGLPPAPREGLAACAGALQRRLGLDQVVIHQARITALADAAGAIIHPAAPLCARPKKTTGAGDRFNAGFCLGLLLGLPPAQRLALGSASGGFFVRHARSGALAELAQFARSWADGSLLTAEAAAAS
jgi:hypothetical protein